MLEQLRKEKVEAANLYRNTLLESKLSVAVEHCFRECEKRPYNEEPLKNYKRYINELSIKLSILPLDKPLHLIPHEETDVVNSLLSEDSFSSMQKKLRMQALLFVFRYLHEETDGVITEWRIPSELKKIIPPREGGRKAASPEDAQEIINAAYDISIRDSLILKMIFHTEHCLHDVLKLDCSVLSYRDGLNDGINSAIGTGVVAELKKYIESTAKIRGDCSKVFISNQGKPLYRTQVQKTLDKANAAAKLPYRITTKMIQRSKGESKK